MKIRLYMDIYPGIDPKHVTASAITYGKPLTSTTRYAINIEIPDPNKPDAIAEVVNVTEEGTE